MERSLGVGLTRMARVYRRGVDQALIAHGLSEARALAVMQIARLGGGVRQGTLAEELGIEGPSMVRLLDQLCAAGLVERRDDPRDGRAKTLHLTAAGEDQARIVEAAVNAFRTRVLAQVDDADLAACQRVFEALELGLVDAKAGEAGRDA